MLPIFTKIAASGFAKGLGSAVQFLWKNRCSVGWIIAIGYPILCFNFHCGGNRCPEIVSSDTTITEIIVPADTGKVMELTGLDVIPEEVGDIGEVVFSPVLPEVDSQATVAEELESYKGVLMDCNRLLEDCDRRLRLASVIRTYKDTASNDSVDVFIEAKVKGELLDWSASHNWKIPTVEKTITVTNVIKDGPYRKFGVGIGLGAQLKRPGNELSGIPIIGGLSYMDKKNNLFQLNGSYVLKGGFLQNGWGIQLQYSRLFDIK